jgi:hypothetical protein
VHQSAFAYRLVISRLFPFVLSQLVGILAKLLAQLALFHSGFRLIMSQGLGFPPRFDQVAFLNLI